jgi:hypothetical protein
MKLENLRTIHNYSLSNGVTTSYIYKLVRLGKIKPVEIDGIKFIDTDKFPSTKTLK